MICSVILNITQFADHVKINSTSQLIKGISRVLQKLLRYFSGTIISTSTLPAILPSLLSAAVWPVVFVLNLNESFSLAPLKLTILPSSSTAGISLQYCHKLPDVFD